MEHPTKPVTQTPLYSASINYKTNQCLRDSASWSFPVDRAPPRRCFDWENCQRVVLAASAWDTFHGSGDERARARWVGYISCQNIWVPWFALRWCCFFGLPKFKDLFGNYFTWAHKVSEANPRYIYDLELAEGMATRASRLDWELRTEQLRCVVVPNHWGLLIWRRTWWSCKVPEVLPAGSQQESFRGLWLLFFALTKSAFWVPFEFQKQRLKVSSLWRAVMWGGDDRNSGLSNF